MKVTIYSTKTGSTVELTTSATTWGGLRQELINKGYYGDGMSAILQTDKKTLQSEDIVMPTEPYTIFLVPTKTKGGTDIPYTVEDVERIQGEIMDLLDHVIEHIEDSKKDSVRALKTEAERILGSLVY